LTKSLKAKKDEYSFPTPPSKKKSIQSTKQQPTVMTKEEQFIAMHDYYDDLL
jgi:hypothetical protein